jgi:antitoxin component of MazEF toxin-antitoxin module
MSKLQQIERSNGSVVSSVNIPKEELEKLSWEKGDELSVTAEEEKLTIRKQ